MTRASWLAIAALLASCAGPTVTLSIGFPSQESFIVTTLVDVRAVPLDGDLDQCPTLLGEALAGTDVHPSMSVIGLVPCDVRGGATLPDPGSGPHALIVLARSMNMSVVLAGCAVGEVYPGGPPISVDLYPTDTYAAAATAAHVTPGATAAQRCMGSSP